MRREEELFADIYPEGKYTCEKCGNTNLKGEFFRMTFLGRYDCKRLCDDCYEEEKRKNDEEQRALYASGEEEPEHTEEVTCPWCGSEISDSWEFEDWGVTECEDCGKEFEYERHLEVTYSSTRIKEESE